MVGMTFTVTGDKEAKRLIDKAARAMKNLKEPLSQIGDAQLKTVDRQFASQGGEITGKWARRKDSLSHPILTKTGRLKKSFKKTKVTNNEVEIGSENPYYKWHQSGSPKGKIPQRQMLGFNDKMIDQAVQIIIRYINNQLKFG